MADIGAIIDQVVKDHVNKVVFNIATGGFNRMLHALKQEHGKCCKALSPRTGQTALHRAAFNGRVEMATWLLEECKQVKLEAAKTKSSSSE